MFFFLSKFLFLFIQPFNWLLVLSLWALLSKNKPRKKRLWVITGCLFLLFSNPLLIQEIIWKWQAEEKALLKGEKYKAGILLTGFCSYNEKNGKGYFREASDRFIQTVRLYQQGHIEKIIVTGGSSKVLKNDQSLKEADFVCEQLLQMGIPAEHIIKENKSRNTHENGTFTKKILDSLNIKPPYLLITSATHIPRAMEVFHKTGSDPIPYPCNFAVIENKIEFPGSFLPSLKSFELWNTFMKENIGLLIYKLTGKA
jgi:uncharacterized SAM-binding protein YcdF (DUF218 family)